MLSVFMSEAARLVGDQMKRELNSLVLSFSLSINRLITDHRPPIT
jgi:hypothetical protein